MQMRPLRAQVRSWRPLISASLVSECQTICRETPPLHTIICQVSDTNELIAPELRQPYPGAPQQISRQLLETAFRSKQHAAAIGILFGATVLNDVRVLQNKR